MDSGRPILLVEDDLVDAMTVKRALKDNKVSNTLLVAHNGEEALALLRATSEEEMPCVVLLDLNMPRMNGLELLQAMKADDILRRIPCVVLTTSRGEQDRIASFNLSVAGYMVKPVDYTRFVEMVKGINMYWTLSEFPH